MKQEETLYKYLAESDKAQQLLENVHNLKLRDYEIYKVLIDYFDVSDIPTKVFSKSLEADQIVDIILSCNLSGQNLITSITMEKSILPDNLGHLEKAWIKFKGEVWEIHKTDVDNFPSNPHAHNYQTNRKLHLGSGELFHKRDYVGKIKKKNLLLLRKRITQKVIDIQLPQLSI